MRHYIYIEATWRTDGVRTDHGWRASWRQRDILHTYMHGVNMPPFVCWRQRVVPPFVSKQRIEPLVVAIGIILGGSKRIHMDQNSSPRSGARRRYRRSDVPSLRQRVLDTCRYHYSRLRPRQLPAGEPRDRTEDAPWRPRRPQKMTKRPKLEKSASKMGRSCI